MNLWDTLKRALGGGSTGSGRGPAGDPDALMLYVRCNNCRENVAVRLNKRNDLVREDDGPGVFFVRKEVMDNKCFRLMRAEVWYDSNYSIVTADVEGGVLLTPQEYENARDPGGEVDS